MESLFPSIAAAVLSSGISVGILNYINARKKESREGITLFLNQLQSDNSRLRERETQNEKRIETLSDRLDDLQHKLMIMEQAHHNLPIPQWMKDKNGVILSMNPFCYDVFLKPFGVTRLEAIGLRDRDIFPPETADVIEDNDRRVIESRRAIRDIEELLIGDKLQKWAVMRYPIIHEGVMVAIGGIAYELIE